VGELELGSAADVTDVELSELLTAAFEGYLVPVTFTPETVAFMARAYDLDRQASRVAVRDGARVGIANVGLRGPDAWVGGIGVVPEERRRGTGRALMEALHEEVGARGTERVWLEVIVENTPALELYDRLGYRHVRDVQVWSVPATRGPVADVPAHEARRTIARHRVLRDPWQRADATVDNLDGVVGLATEGAAAIARVTGGRAQLLQAAGTAEELPGVVRAAAGLGDSMRVLNVDPADALASALDEVEGRIDATQHELVLHLAS
jgi:GNAT superfamily N-acetyltransferase